MYAVKDTVSGLPEIKTETIPGRGGNQRLVRTLGKHKVNELILTGDFMSGKDLKRFGLAVTERTGADYC